MDIRARIFEAVESICFGDGDTATDAVLAVIDEAAQTRCTDRDCVRRGRHNVLGPHLWKHSVQPPVTFGFFTCFCFTCGHRSGHRIHSGRTE